MRTCARNWIKLALALWLALLCLPICAGEPRHFEDATLHAIQFVDGHPTKKSAPSSRRSQAQVGWAVGDDGVLWHTIDGGMNWDRRSSGVRASLRSVFFHNPYVGWIAGRQQSADGQGSVGVLLFTEDGGETWRHFLPNTLPGLHCVHFANDKTGYLVGDSSTGHPTGVFVTHDSGNTWKPVPGPRCPTWLAVASRADHAALGGTWMHLARVQKDRLSMIELDRLGGRRVHDITLFPDQGGVAVGDGGLVLLNADKQGARWHFVSLGLPREVQAGWDLHAVCRMGQHLWAVGRPGSMALHSPDLGRTWKLVRTGHPLPLRDVYFADEKHGWVVGELGTILFTRDGGKTWSEQRRGGQRAAVLCIHARPASTPLDAVALLGAEQGYLTVGLCMTSADPQSAALERSADPERFASAFRHAGGASANLLWQFPVPSHAQQSPRTELLQQWGKQHGGPAAEQILRQLVLALRIWHPDVLLTDLPDPKTGTPLEDLVTEAVSEALKQASDPARFPEHIRFMGLKPAKPTKLYAVWTGDRGTHVRVDLNEVRPRLEQSIGEFVRMPCVELLGCDADLPSERWFRCLAGPRGSESQLMKGVLLTPGGPARRVLKVNKEASPATLRAARRRAQLRTLVRAPADELKNPARILSLLGPTLADMPDNIAATALHGIASQYARRGQWTLAREAFLLQVERYPTHPLTRDAYRWLICHHASSEARRRYELGQFVRLQTTKIGLPSTSGVPLGGPMVTETPKEKGSSDQAPDKTTPTDKPDSKASEKPRFKLPEVHGTETQQERQLMVRKGGSHVWQWYQSSLSMAAQLRAFGPLVAQDPCVPFCLQSARRNLGQHEKARKWYQTFAARQSPGPWRDAARAELWLKQSKGKPPKPLFPCKHTTRRPHLDGKLNDACWQETPVVLKAAAGQAMDRFPTQVQLAYDRQYLYLAVRCQHPTGRQLPSARTRQRDADLRGFDRISLLLDLDRDYTTCCQLQVDQRGCVSEDCWGDKTWNPRWFVAVNSTATEWVVEAAFPLTALTGNSVLPGHVWAGNIIRTIPGQGVQAWSLPAEVPEESLRLEGMGLLMFQGDLKKIAPASYTQPHMPRVP